MATIDRDKIEGVVSTSVTVSGAGSSATITISAAASGSGSAILQLSEGSLNFGDTETTKTFMVKNVGSTGTVLDWAIANPNVDWLTLTPMTGNTNAGSGTQVTAVVDRNIIHGTVSTTITVNGASNSANLSVSAVNFQPTMEVPVTDIDFGKTSSQETFQIRNTGETGSYVNWSISTPSVNWLTISPMTGSTNTTSPSTVTLNVDRNAFVGNETISINITGAGSTATVTITIDNSVIITNGLLAYYSFDDGNVTDWSGNYNGFNQNAISSNDTPNGQGLSMEFDGYSSYLQIPYNLFQNGVWSYNMWFKTQNCSYYRVFFGTNLASEGVMCLNSSGSFYINNKSGYMYQYWQTSGVLPNCFNNQWHMLTITYNGEVASLYFDGSLFETKNTTYLYWGTNYTNTYIGGDIANTSSKNYYDGNMDNIRTYNRALTAAEVRALYNAKQ